jgi:hypothetical protein
MVKAFCPFESPMLQKTSERHLHDDHKVLLGRIKAILDMETVSVPDSQQVLGELCVRYRG